ncbi:MAG: hypothetical protein IJU12_11205, partial [Clostridia bacterium]|nr:hypothetical protein [Clostridia bacterium]
MKNALLMLAALLLVLALCLTCAALADENGQPDEFSLGSHLKKTFGIFEDREEIGLTHDDYIGQAWINDYNYWSATLENLPVWTVTYTNDAGGVIGYEIWEDSGNSGMHFNLKTYPSDYSAIHYTVTVSWGNYSASLNGTLSFVQLSANELPNGF